MRGSKVDETHRLYLRDLGYLVREAAVEAKLQASAAGGTGSEGFEVGRLQAYWEVVSLMLSQATAFGIPAEDLGLAGVDPDRDLMGG
jgi:hypothetical protein